MVGQCQDVHMGHFIFNISLPNDHGPIVPKFPKATQLLDTHPDNVALERAGLGA